MRSRPLMAAVLATGLVATACSNSPSTDVQSIADSTTTTGSATSSSAPAAQPALQVDVTDGAGGQPATDGSTSTIADQVSATDSQTTATTPTTAATTAATAATTTAATVAPTTATTAAPTTATTAAPTTVATTTASGTETRPEILRLALPKFGGGNFDPNSVAGKPVVLWFWGAH